MKPQDVLNVISGVLGAQVDQVVGSSVIQVRSAQPKEIFFDAWFSENLVNISIDQFEGLFNQMVLDDKWFTPANSKTPMLLLTEITVKEYLD